MEAKGQGCRYRIGIEWRPGSMEQFGSIFAVSLCFGEGSLGVHLDVIGIPSGPLIPYQQAETRGAFGKAYSLNVAIFFWEKLNYMDAVAWIYMNGQICGFWYFRYY